MIFGRTRARLAGVVGRILAVAAAVTLAAATASGTPAAGTPVAFTIAGSADRLYPGLATSLRLTVTNDEAFAIVVTSIAATAGNASNGCPAGYLTLGHYAGALTIAGRRSAVVTISIALQHAAPDACQGALFPLSYTGLARKA